MSCTHAITGTFSVDTFKCLDCGEYREPDQVLVIDLPLRRRTMTRLEALEEFVARIKRNLNCKFTKMGDRELRMMLDDLESNTDRDMDFTPELDDVEEPRE